MTSEQSTTEPPPLLNTPENQISHKRLILTLFAIAVLYAVFASCSSLWDRDEPRFCRAAVEMMAKSDFIVPTFNGDLRPDKPIWVYWLMIVSMKLFGISELALRLPSVLGMTATAGLTYFLGKRMFNPVVGYRAMLFFATALIPIYIGTAATADGSLLPWITFSIYIIVDRLYTQAKWWHWPALALALGIAQLAKGPVGLAIPVLMVVGTMWYGRKVDSLRSKLVNKRFLFAFMIAITASIGLFLAWGIPANNATNGEYGRIAIGKHVVGRATSAMEGHGGTGMLGYLAMLPLYVPILLIGFLPWTTHLIGTLFALAKRAVGTPRDRAIILGWCMPTFVMMTLVATKLPHYILPIFPALAITISATLQTHHIQPLTPRFKHAFRAGGGATVVAFIIGAGGLLIGPWLIPHPILALAAAPAGIVAIVIAIKIAKSQYTDQLCKSTKTLMWGPPLFMLLVGLLVIPRVEPWLKTTPSLGRTIAKHIEPDADLYEFGYNEPTVVYYSNLGPNQKMRSIWEVSKSFEEWANLPGSALLVVSEDATKEAGIDIHALGLHEVFRHGIFNYSSHGRQQQIIIFKRDNPSTP